MLTRQLILISLSCLLGSALAAPASLADDSSASLDSMWIDQEAPTIDKEDSKNPAGTVASVGGVGALPNIVAPMCAFEDFRKSSFVSKSNWPGLGPFTASANDISELIDDKQNHLKLHVKNDQVTAAQLGIGKLGTGHVRDFLDIEMAADFLLESLGAKPRKIADFNTQLERNRNQIVPGANNISLAAGRYQVTFDRSKHARPYACLISINSLDANKSLLATTGATAKEEAVPEHKEEAPAQGASIFERVMLKKPAGAKTKASPNPAISPTVDSKRDDFEATIKAWQQIKKAAVKKRDTAHLSDILYGTALKRQIMAIQWLQTHGNYYDMVPKGCIVEEYNDLGDGKKYKVSAKVREFSKYIRESDNTVLKEGDDQYLVYYTLEKVNNKWMITDSDLPKPNQQAQAAAHHAQNKTH